MRAPLPPIARHSLDHLARRAASPHRNPRESSRRSSCGGQVAWLWVRTGCCSAAGDAAREILASADAMSNAPPHIPSAMSMLVHSLGCVRIPEHAWRVHDEHPAAEHGGGAVGRDPRQHAGEKAHARTRHAQRPWRTRRRRVPESSSVSRTRCTGCRESGARRMPASRRRTSAGRPWSHECASGHCARSLPDVRTVSPHSSSAAPLSASVSNAPVHAPPFLGAATSARHVQKHDPEQQHRRDDCRSVACAARRSIIAIAAAISTTPVTQPITGSAGAASIGSSAGTALPRTMHCTPSPAIAVGEECAPELECLRHHFTVSGTLHTNTSQLMRSSAAVAGARNVDDEVLLRRRRDARLHRNAHEILRGIVVGAPLPVLPVDDELHRAVALSESSTANTHRREPVRRRSSCPCRTSAPSLRSRRCATLCRRERRRRE